MVDDIVLSPEEQAEQTKEWLKKNIPSIFIGLALGISLVYGYTTYTCLLYTSPSPRDRG